MSNSAIGRHFGIGHAGISKRLEKYGLSSKFIPPAIELRGDDMKCTSCGEFYPPGMFEKNSRFTRRQCNSCHNKQTVVRRYSTKERRIRAHLNRIKHASTEKSTPFNLDYDYIKGLLKYQGNKCFYSDHPIVFYAHGETPSRGMSPSIDKIVPGNGYVKGNVVWCLDRYNRMKNDATLEEMKLYMPMWYERVRRHMLNNQHWKF